MDDGQIKAYPIPDEDSKAFWEAALRHELVIKRCGDCDFYIHYPKPFCPKCWSENIIDAIVSGRGTIFTFAIVRQPIAPGIDPPYVSALVELEEQIGLRLVANVIGCSIEDVEIGLPVEVTWEDRAPELTVPQFTPRRASNV